MGPKKGQRGVVKTVAQICQNEPPPTYAVDDTNLQERTEAAWEQVIASEWAADWADPREDIYSLADGEPIHVAQSSIGEKDKGYS